MTMRLLHTSDWHLGRNLFTKRRHSEFEQFLDWLVALLDREQIDCLVIAGDVFDTTTPSNTAQELYFHFLSRAALSRCRHIIVVAGNHDSPSLLDAPRTLLKSLRIHVIGTVTTPPENEVIPLYDSQGDLQILVCAVPFLPDRDVRKSMPGETLDDKERKLAEGIRDHYRTVCEHAKSLRDQAGRRQTEQNQTKGSQTKHVPIIATGHLFAAGGTVHEEEEGVRDLYVGALGQIGSGIFPDFLDYVALGHLHIPQIVDGKNTIRYSGSPIPMGFGETSRNKSVILVDCDLPIRIQNIPVPEFQKLATIRGDWNQIVAKLAAFKLESENIWLEIDYTGEELIPDLRQRIDKEIERSTLEVLRIQNRRTALTAMLSSETVPENQSLSEMTCDEIFDKCLFAHWIPDEQHAVMKTAYKEVMQSLLNPDSL